jgi:hypothetical protein
MIPVPNKFIKKMHEEVEAKLHTLSTSIFGGDEY